MNHSNIFVSFWQKINTAAFSLRVFGKKNNTVLSNDQTNGGYQSSRVFSDSDLDDSAAPRTYKYVYDHINMYRGKV